MADKTRKIPGFNPREQARYDEYYAKLERLEPGVLANELAVILVMAPLIPVDKIIERITENTRIVRHNRKVRADRKKALELQAILAKKRPTPADNVRANKLAKDLKIDV